MAGLNSTGVHAQAAYFGPPETRLFGWLHRSDAAAGKGLALLICSPFGFEAVCAHRSLRTLANATAANGVPTLRFDYAGCGNSDDVDDADLLPRWLSSVDVALDSLKQATGARRVVLLGVRLGAALASLSAVRRDDVAGLIAIAPVLRGRAYLRELTLLGHVGAPDPGSAARGLESAGFVLPQPTCDSLSKLDLRALQRAPASRVVIVERDDLSESGAWSDALRGLGADVQVERWPGYAAMVDDPQRARTPERIVEGVVDLLGRWGQGAATAELPVLPWGERVLHPDRPGSSEGPLGLPAGDCELFGVMHRPASPRRGPAVLMLNAGSVHSIGPNRLWVRLARRWAAHGVRVLRLDISGIGDSDPRPGAVDNVVYSPHAMDDVAAALECLRDHEGATQCHVMGLCSGAYHAFKAATTGMPVASALMINPLTYFWAAGATLEDVKDYEVVELSDRYLDKFFTREPWLRLLRGELHLSLICDVARRRMLSALARGWRALARALAMPIRDDLARELRRAERAHVPLRFVFAQRATGHTLLRQHGGRALRELLQSGSASIDFVADADHTFTRAQARERLVELIDPMMLRACEAEG